MTESTIYILKIIDWALFCLAMLGTLYILSFSFASLFRVGKKIPESQKLLKFLVIFPSYKEDKIIVQSIESFLLQKYPKEKYEIVIVSDGMKEETNTLLRELPVRVAVADYQNSTKAKALQLAIKEASDTEYDMVVILDADNTVDDSFLYHINNAGALEYAIQAHRTSKKRNSPTAVLDAVSEEINNSIFRKGHINLGLSSALIGSGMAFDYHWFKDNVSKLSSSGEDKEIEILLLKQKIHISYLNDVYVYDEKTQKSSAFYNQRRRWIATQFYSLKRGVTGFFPALFTLNISYLDKIIQWMLPPRIIQIASIGIIALILTFMDISLSIKWWVLLAVTLLSIIMAIPRKYFDKKLLKALLYIPLLTIYMFINIFRIKGADKKFIHTEK